MKKIIAILLAAALLIIPTACSMHLSVTAGPKHDEVSDTDVDTVTDTDAQADPTPAADPKLHTVMEYDPEFAKYKIANTFGADGMEKNLIWCECDITDIRIIPVEYDVENDSFTFAEYPEFVMDSLKAGEAILLDLVIPEVIPDRAVSYKVGDAEYTYILTYNGRDGGIWLMDLNN